MDTPDTPAPIPTEGAATLVTRDGVVVEVRPVQASDEPVLAALFEHVSPADLRFRFLSGMRHVDHARIADMVHVDYVRTITFIAFDQAGEPLATVWIMAPDGRIVAGFRTGLTYSVLYAHARARDFILADGPGYYARIESGGPS